jgi:hypothetical protein
VSQAGHPAGHPEGHHEAIRGLPGTLPAGEHILWQGAPGWWRLALTAFHVRGIAAYFAVLVAWAAISGAGAAGIAATLAAAVAALLVVGLIAWLAARTTVYTITNRRVVLRIGMALSACINIPFGIVANAGLKLHGDGSGDLPLAITGDKRMGYAMLWPHARPWRIAEPEPMLRAIPDAETVAALLARALAEAIPAGRRAMPAAADDRSGALHSAAAAA